MSDFQYYEKDGKKYDRITTILSYFPSPSLMDWKIKMFKKFCRELIADKPDYSLETVIDKSLKKLGKIVEDAGDIGNDIDEYLKARIMGNKLQKLKSVDSTNCLEAFDSWLNDYPMINLNVSDTVFNDDLMVAGTPDFHDSETVYDLKSSNKIREKYWLQTEFYARSLGKKFKAILRTHKGLAIYEYKKVPLNDEHWEVVKSAVNLYRYYKGDECDNNN